MTRRLLSIALLSVAAFGVTLPRPAPDMQFSTATGPHLISQYRGKVVVVTFVMTECGHCRENAKVLNVIQNEYASKGVQILGGAFDQNAPAMIGQFIAAAKPTFPVGVVDPDAFVSFSQVTKEMKPAAPVLVFIDRKGMIRFQAHGAEPLFKGDVGKNIRAEIDKLLK
jgi:peroxiredoxin